MKREIQKKKKIKMKLENVKAKHEHAKELKNWFFSKAKNDKEFQRKNIEIKSLQLKY